MLKLKKVLFILSLLFLTLVPLSPAFMDGPADNQYGLQSAGARAGYSKTQGVYSFIDTAVSAMLAMIAVVLFGLIFYAGFRWMTAQGNEEHIEKAKNIIEAAAIGLMIVFASYGVTYFVFKNLGVVQSNDAKATSPALEVDNQNAGQSQTLESDTNPVAAVPQAETVNCEGKEHDACVQQAGCVWVNYQINGVAIANNCTSKEKDSNCRAAEEVCNNNCPDEKCTASCSDTDCRANCTFTAMDNAEQESACKSQCITEVKACYSR